jgi:hypothetical protein
MAQPNDRLTPVASIASLMLCSLQQRLPKQLSVVQVWQTTPQNKAGVNSND